MRILALDYGRKRIGVSLSDPLKITAQPQPYITQSKKALENIVQLIHQSSVETIVVGLPLTMKGTDSEMTKEVRNFASQLESLVAVPVVLYDERCTSSQANNILIEANVRREKRKEIVDSMAATILLQAYLSEFDT